MSVCDFKSSLNIFIVYIFSSSKLIQERQIFEPACNFSLHYLACFYTNYELKYSILPQVH